MWVIWVIRVIRVIITFNIVTHTNNIRTASQTNFFLHTIVWIACGCGSKKCCYQARNHNKQSRKFWIDMLSHRAGGGSLMDREWELSIWGSAKTWDKNLWELDSQRSVAEPRPVSHKTQSAKYTFLPTINIHPSVVCDSKLFRTMNFPRKILAILNTVLDIMPHFYYV